jgi:hypothetical protein
MKKSTFYSLLFIIVFLLVALVQSNAQTFVARTSAADITQVEITSTPFSGVEILEDKESSTIRFELSVSLKCEKGESSFGSAKTQKLARLLAEGLRYEYQILQEDDRLSVSLPNVENVLFSKSLGNIEETLKIRIFVPKGMKVTLL